MAVTDLAGEVLAAATALGVVDHGQLSTAFFSDPLGHLKTIVTDTEQRTALLATLDALLPPPDELSGGHATDTNTRHPIVRTAQGALALSVTRNGPANDPTVILGLWGTATHEGSGCTAEVSLPLVQGNGS